jgi:Ca2+-binding RTX toxin-like protein
MVGWNFTLGPSLVANGVSLNDQASILSIFNAAGDIWSRYLGESAASIDVVIEIKELSDNALGEAGPLEFVTVGGGVVASGVTFEIREGTDPNGVTADAMVTIDLGTFLAGEFYFDPAPLLRTLRVPIGQFDFLSFVLHELGHALGFVELDAGTTEFETFITLTEGARFFNGPDAVEFNNSPLPLETDSPHFLLSFLNPLISAPPLLGPEITPRGRLFITPLEISVLSDLGINIPSPTNSNDVLFGYNFFDDRIFLKAGDDQYAGFGGADFVSGGTGSDTIDGGPGSDTLYGDGARDVIFGDTGEDLIFGGLGADELRGGEGNDTIYGGGGADTLKGGLSADLLTGGTGDDQLFGGDGDDTLDGGNRNDSQISGQYGDDLLFGGSGVDQLNGGYGWDTLDAGGGNDTALGGDGNDSLFGGSGDDLLKGGAGNDTIDGGNGVDTLSGGSGNDLLFGGSGEDSLTGNDGDDTLEGGNRNDTLEGQFGNDKLDGGRNNDVLFGGNGDDTLIGGRGNDTMSGESGENLFIIEIGDGQDVIRDFQPGIDSIQIMSSGEIVGGSVGLLASAQQINADVLLDLGATDTILLENIDLNSISASDILFVSDFEALTTADGQILSFSGIDLNGYRPTQINLDVTLEVSGVIKTGTGLEFNQNVIIVTANSVFENNGLIDARLVGTVNDSNSITAVGLGESAEFTNNNMILVSGSGGTIAGVAGSVSGRLITNAGLIEVFNDVQANEVFAILGGNIPTVINSGDIRVNAVSDSTGIVTGNALVINTGTIEVNSTLNANSFVAMGIVTNSGDIENLGSIVVTAENGYAYGVVNKNGGEFENAGTITVSGLHARGFQMIREGNIINSNDIIVTSDDPDMPSIGMFLASLSGKIITVNNSGSIVADNAIYAVSFGLQYVTNTGLIDGNIDLGAGADRIDNSNGEIRGNVNLGDAADLFDNRTGIITGDVSGGKGDDTLLGGVGAETLSGNTGNDVIEGGSGGDWLKGGAGDDTLDGGDSDDTLNGQNGDDVLAGGNNNDWLVGGGGSDTLIGGAGDDSLFGQAGDDRFVFSPGAGADEITGFEAGAATDDVIDLSAMGAAFDSFAEALAAASDDGFGNTVIDFGLGDTITLLGVAIADLHQDDFVFI